MQIQFSGTGPPELQREDGWIYRLHGVGGMEMVWGHYDDDWGVLGVTSYSSRSQILEVTVYDLSDRTLDSIRVLRDSFPDFSIRLNHDI